MFTFRWADTADIPAITAVMDRAISVLQQGFLSPAEIVASRSVMGLDTQLIADGTYLLAERDERLAGCGGWSPRATLYGGDHSHALRDAAMLDPAKDAVRIRAMYVHPDFARQGLGRAILARSEGAARAANFASAEMMATLAGEPLYRACGYAPIESVLSAPVEGVHVPLIRMRKPL